MLERPLAIVYAAGALLGLVTALWFGLPYWTAPGASLAGFSALAFANAPAATLGADIACVYVLANVWIVVEGRRAGMRHLWLYLLANTLVAVAFGWALFLAVREATAPRPAAGG